jgi:hypothetical protein
VAAYREDRKATAVPTLKPITRSEAQAGSDVKRQQQFEEATRASADEVRAARRQPSKRFAAVLERKK